MSFTKKGTRYNLITVLGLTASGKTRFAAHLAEKINGEIISGDSRQVYQGMNLGTGKDYSDYNVNGKNIPYHLVDIAQPGYKYSVYEFQQDFCKVFREITNRKKIPVLCGGSGMYVDSVLQGYRLIHVPVNPDLRKELEKESMSSLAKILASFKKPHNVTDTSSRERLIRAIEIETYYKQHQEAETKNPEINSLIIGIKFDREDRRKRITERLKDRLKNGMVEEVESLMNSGVSPETLIYYGLEYKYITLYLLQKLSREEMFTKLETAIHQFAKRQMTWFRGMERKGIKIHWLDGRLPMEEKIERTLRLLRT
ncbi:MAG: tRNA (adenosine(37)-N6)-dimethylallyltransferase MiaA [Bacteroidetes bacterium]|nr:tRNA (adenosine(37)-N6)-dimethylallyltransferase MiaA [Bacteroidota bacterium]